MTRDRSEVDAIAVKYLRSRFSPVLSSLFTLTRQFAATLFAVLAAWFTLTHWVELFSLPRLGLAVYAALLVFAGAIIGYVSGYSSRGSFK